MNLNDYAQFSKALCSLWICSQSMGLKWGTAQEPLSGALRFAMAFTRHVIIVAAQQFQFSAPN